MFLCDVRVCVTHLQLDELHDSIVPCSRYRNITVLYKVKKYIVSTRRFSFEFNPCLVFGSMGPVYYTLKTGPTDPNITQSNLGTLFF